MDPTSKYPNTGIVVDYYQGAYGPMLRIDTTRIEELLSVRTIFMDLAQNDTDFANFLQLTGITAIGVDALILRRLESQDPYKKCLQLRKTRSRSNQFHWSMPGLDWWSCVSLVDALIEFGEPAHQYLNQSREGIDDALIELTYMESSDLRGLKSP